MEEEINKKFDIILEKIDELSEGVTFLGKKYEELKNNIKTTIDNQDVLNKAILKLSKENKEQRKEIVTLKERLENLERNSLESTLNLYPVLKTAGEDLKDMIKKVAVKAGLTLVDSDILSIYRKPEKKNGKPGDVIVKCVNKSVRDKIIEGTKLKRLMHKDIGITCDIGRVYANEELTVEGKNIYFKALKLKYDKKWKFIWVKNGRIFVRKEEGSPSIRLDTMNDLDKLL